MSKNPRRVPSRRNAEGNRLARDYRLLIGGRLVRRL